MASQEFGVILEELELLGQRCRKTSIARLFDTEPERHAIMAKTAVGITFDFSKQLVTEATLQKLLHLAKASDLRTRLDLMVTGGIVNDTEGRQALHTSLRGALSKNRNVPYKTQILETLHRVEEISAKIRTHRFFIHDQIPISDVVHIGIGGSCLGPKLAKDALRYSSKDKFPVHFLANIDPGEFDRVVDSLKPESTLFVIASKSFGTKETIQNALSAKQWLASSINSSDQINKHFIAITNNKKKGLDYGISEENILPVESWVGGRYSMWSPLGLPVAIHLGMDVFNELLVGASEMDEHFFNSNLENCLPVLLALISFWNTNILGAETSAMVPYDDRLRFLPEHLQQLEMESNGKRVDRNGGKLAFDSAPVTWGGLGTNAQHAFFQLLHQGGRFIPVDFFIALSHPSQITKHHDMLVASCLAQSESLMRGSNPNSADNSKSHLICPGNQPNSIISFDALTPSTFGALISLYEHKTFVLSVLLNINPFDQWGVELGKSMASDITDEIKRGTAGESHDASTTKILNRFLKLRGTKV